MFDNVKNRTTANKVGVTFCGNPMIGGALMDHSNRCTIETGGKIRFNLHSEVF
jgi:hypothetical protein